MKFIKLNGRHNLHRKGFRFAFSFDGYEDNMYKIEQLVRETEKLSWGTHTFYGKPRDRRSVRKFYVGFRDEETALIVELKRD